MITPESFKLDTEESHQKALMSWCALNLDKYPELRWLHHSPNGGYRNKREAANFKIMGVKSGFPDLILLVPRGEWHGLLIELKHPSMKGKKNDGASEAQLGWGEFLINGGYGFKLCHGWKDARDTLVQYLEWRE